MTLRIIINLVIISLLAVSCNMTLEVGLEQVPTETISASVATTIQVDTPATTTSAVSPTNTARPPALPTSPSTATREAITNTPIPSPLPGLTVIPLSSMGRDIPWLPVDKARWPTVHVVTFNTLLPPFDNPFVRQAFAAAIDKEVIVEMAKSYYAIDPSPATTFIPPQTLGRNLYREVGINFDPDRARDLLAQAGYQDTSSFPTVTFIVNSYGNTAPGARFNMANAMAEMWLTHLGVTVEVKALEPASFRNSITSNPPGLFWIGWLPDPGNDPDFIRLTYHSDADLNYGHFSNLEFDSLVDRAAAVHDPASRQLLYIEAERVLCETEAGIIPLYYTFMKIP